MFENEKRKIVMEEELITFETAKLAKEKGFDIQSKTGYHPDTGKSINENLWRSISRVESDRHIQKPSQSFLQKWLREVHKIHIIINTYNNSIEQIRWEIDIRSIKPNRLLFEHTEYNFYEEALEEGLQEGLKLIK